MQIFSIEIHGEISMEFHGKCPNPPWRYSPWKSMEKFPWNSMEIDVLILHGISWRIFHGTPWNSMEVFHTGRLSLKSKMEGVLAGGCFP